MRDPVELHREAKRLFTGALEQEPEARAAWLRARCQGDTELFEMVRALLTHAASDHPLLRDAGDEAPGSAAAPAPRRFGRYTIHQKLAEGGMGAVYEAEQDSPRRRVALKIVRAGFASDTGLRRFEMEGEILGRLHHPRIAQVFEAGRAGDGEDGKPFIAMELIDGVTLDRYVADRSLSHREIVAMMAEVCDAIAHAHQRGIIHRDLKPGNILVERDGAPKVVDFGIARVTGENALKSRDLTMAGQVLGTLAYMSPEQVTGEPEDVDTRTDVYSLGVILYELLSGRAPLELQDCTYFDALRRIRDVEPVRLATREPRCAGDLATIVEKAMAKDREQRYASAAALGADLRHFLADEPISARPPSTVYQLRKFARRHKGVVAAASLAVLSLIGGLIATAVQGARAEAARAGAEQRLREVEAIQGYLQQIVRTARPSSLGRDVTVRDALAHVEQSLSETLADSPRIEAAVRNSFGMTLNTLGEWRRAALHLERALELCGPSDERLASEIHCNLGRARLELGEFAEAERHATLAAEAQRRLGTVSEALPSVILNLASVLERRGDYDRADRCSREAIGLLESLPAARRDRALAIAHSNRCGLLRDLGKLAEAEASIHAAMAIMEANGWDDSADFARMSNQLAHVLAARGRWDEAVAVRRRAKALADEHIGPRHPDSLAITAALAEDLGNVGQLEEALQLARESLAARREILPSPHPHLAHGLTILAKLLTLSGDPAAAQPLAREAVQGEAQAGRSRGRLAMRARLELVRATREAGDTGTAVTLAEALVRDLDALPEGHWSRGIYLREYGQVLLAAGRAAEGTAALQRSYAVLSASLGEAHPETRATRDLIAR